MNFLQEMESSIARLSKKHFLCSLCEDIFKTPVTTPCGHSFCKVCLRKYWSGAGSGKCPLCCKTFVSKPHLSVNHILADVTEHYRKSHMERKAKSLNVDVLLTEPVCGTFSSVLRWCLFCVLIIINVYNIKPNRNRRVTQRWNK